MTKRLKNELMKLKYNNEPMKFGFLGMVLIVACFFLIVTATFTQLKFDYSWFSAEKLFQYLYVPQVPAIMFTAILLGLKMGLTCVLLYILLGMFFPFFAFGGGFEYIIIPVFGYILAYIPAVIFVGILSKRDNNFANVLKMAAVCVFTIHFLGMMYSLSVMAITNAWNGDIFEFIYLQSGVKFIYDFVLCIVAVYFARMVKQVVWLFAS